MSYTGYIVHLPVGTEGMTGSQNLSVVKPNQLILANGTTYENGTVQKEGGAAKYNGTSLGTGLAVMGGFDWWPNASTQYMIVALSNGTVLRGSATGTPATTLVSGLTLTSGSGALPVFVEGGKEQASTKGKLFMFSGTNPVQVFTTGATGHLLASGPSDWVGFPPTFGFNHNQRIWAGGNSNNPHTLYYSQGTNHEKYSASGTFPGGNLTVFPGEGERLIGGLSYKGLAIVWKYPRGAYIINTLSNLATGWSVSRLSPSVGMRSPLAFSVIDDDVAWMDQDGNIQVLSAVQEFGDVSSKNLSQIADMAPFIRTNINIGKLAQARAVYYPLKREMHIAVPQISKTYNSARLVVDFNRLDLPRFRYSDRDTPISMWMRRDVNQILRPMMGDNQGFIWELDTTAKNKDGVGYTSVFQTGHLDLSHVDPKLGTMMKTGDFLELVTDQLGKWIIYVDIYWDGSYKQTVQFDMKPKGFVLGSGVLGSGSLGTNLVMNLKKRITGQGRRFSYKAYNNNADEDYSVMSFYLHFRPTDERTR